MEIGGALRGLEPSGPERADTVHEPAPGNYTLRIRAVSNEEKYKVYEERSLGLSVARPLWAGTWAIAGYASLCVLAGVVSFRVAMLRRQKRISDEKTCFFIHTAHDVRTPLTLIKAPLEEVVEKDMVKAEGWTMYGWP